jgi:hypothetical protein
LLQYGSGWIGRPVKNGGFQHNRDFFCRYNRLEIRFAENDEHPVEAVPKGQSPWMMVHFTGADSVSGDSVNMGWFQDHWAMAVLGTAGALKLGTLNLQRAIAQ